MSAPEIPYFTKAAPLIRYGQQENEQLSGESIMQRRTKDRRVSTITPPFPLLTVLGRIMEDRRVLPDRRINNIQVKFLNDVGKAERLG
jgi:hypothetical protein